MATKTATVKSLRVLCPFCMDGDSITLELSDLNQITCGACSQDFTAKEAVAKAAEILGRWEAVRDWIDSAPVVAD